MQKREVNGSKTALTLQEEGQEGDEEHEEDTDDTTPDPLKHGHQVVASRLSADGLALIVVLANEQLLVERAEEEHYKSKTNQRKSAPARPNQKRARVSERVTYDTA